MKNMRIHICVVLIVAVIMTAFAGCTNPLMHDETKKESNESMAVIADFIDSFNKKDFFDCNLYIENINIENYLNDKIDEKFINPFVDAGYLYTISSDQKENLRKHILYYIARDTIKDTISMKDNTIRVTYYGISTDMWDEIMEKAAANMTDITYNEIYERICQFLGDLDDEPDNIKSMYKKKFYIKLNEANKITNDELDNFVDSLFEGVTKNGLINSFKEGMSENGYITDFPDYSNHALKFEGNNSYYYDYGYYDDYGECYSEDEYIDNEMSDYGNSDGDSDYDYVEYESEYDKECERIENSGNDVLIKYLHKYQDGTMTEEEFLMYANICGYFLHDELYN